MRAFPLRRVLAVALTASLACPALVDAGALSQAQCAQGNPSSFSGQGSCTSVSATSPGGTAPALSMSQPTPLSPDNGTPPPNMTAANWGGGSGSKSSGGFFSGLMKNWGPTLGAAGVVAGMSVVGFLVGGPAAGLAMLAVGALGIVGMKLMHCDGSKPASSSSGS